MNRAVLVVTALAVPGCFSIHVHDSKNAPGKGSEEAIAGDLDAPTINPPEDPGESLVWIRAALPIGGGAALGETGEPGFFLTGLELSFATLELERSHGKPMYREVVNERPLRPALGYLFQIDGRSDRNAFGPGRVYAEIQYEGLVEPKSDTTPGWLLGAGPFFEHGRNAFGFHASVCGWFIGTLFVRPCVRPAIRTDYGFELSAFGALQGYFEWYTSR